LALNILVTAGIENGVDKGFQGNTHIFTAKVTALGICWGCCPLSCSAMGLLKN